MIRISDKSFVFQNKTKYIIFLNLKEEMNITKLLFLFLPYDFTKPKSQAVQYFWYCGECEPFFDFFEC